tara:strand:+ start:89 stop:367 length:279 start_codon:yes stop_codon:yes gene_type:complete
LDFNKLIVGRYPNLFGDPDDEPEDERYIIDPSTIFAREWGSYQEIYELAQGDITRFNEVTKLPLQQCLMYLSYLKAKTDVETLRFNKNKIKK